MLVVSEGTTDAKWNSKYVLLVSCHWVLVCPEVLVTLTKIIVTTGLLSSN